MERLILAHYYLFFSWCTLSLPSFLRCISNNKIARIDVIHAFKTALHTSKDSMPQYYKFLHYQVKC